MRVWILMAFLPCALLAQTSPPRLADRDAFRKLPQRLDWLQVGTPSAQNESGAQLFASASNVRPGYIVFVGEVLPDVCSIPLLRAPIPEGVFDRMSVPRPLGRDLDPKFTLPTPPVCEASKP